MVLVIVVIAEITAAVNAEELLLMLLSLLLE
jgi:hypothetical protein